MSTPILWLSGAILICTQASTRTLALAGKEPSQPAVPKALLEERLRLAETIYGKRFNQIRNNSAGVLPIALLPDATRLFEAHLGLADGDKAARLAAYGKRFEDMTEIERVAQAWATTGAGREADALRARCYRMGAEIEFLRAGGKIEGKPATEQLLKDLLTQRISAAEKAYAQDYLRVYNSQGLPTELYNASRGVLDAQLSLAGKEVAGRRKAYGTYLKRAEGVQNFIGEAAKAGTATQRDLQAAIYYRLDAETNFLQAGGTAQERKAADLKKLREQRAHVAEKVYQLKLAAAKSGQVIEGPSELPEWSRRLLRAELATLDGAKSPRLAALERHCQRTSEIEQICRRLAEKAGRSELDALVATYYRAEARILLCEAGRK